MKKNVDMTTGSSFKKILAFSIPTALGLMLQNLYSLGDTLIVSLSRGKEAATGVNLTESLSFLILGFGSGIAAGFGIVLSQFVGAKDENGMKKSLAASITLSAVIGVIITVLTVIFAGPLLTLMKTDGLYYDFSLKYITAIFAGFMFNLFYNLAAQIMRALGDSKTPLIILVLAATINILLDSALFITNWSVAWAGWATVISQAISATIGFILILKKYPELRLKRTDFKFSAKLAIYHLTTGLPMGFQFTVTAIGCMIQQSAFNALPDPRYAMAQSTGSKIDNVFNSLLMGAANTMAVYTGQNYGAKKIDRIKKGMLAGMASGLIYTAVATAAAIPLCVPFAKFLLKGAENVVYDWVFRYITTQACFYYVLYILMMFRQCLQGLGYSVLTIFGGVTELVFRYIAAITLAVNFGYAGACFSNPLAWTGGAAFFVISYFAVIKKTEKKLLSPSDNFLK